MEGGAGGKKDEDDLAAAEQGDVFLRKLQTDILNKIVLAGIPGVKKAFLRAQEYQAWNAQGKLEKVHVV
jgi:hypothetical protein